MAELPYSRLKPPQILRRDEMVQFTFCTAADILQSILPTDSRVSVIAFRDLVFPRLPDTVEILHIQTVPREFLPELQGIDGFPSNLEVLNVTNNFSTRGQPLALPAFPASLWRIWLWDCGLQTVPALPPGLRELSLDKNQLEDLPLLPNTLTDLSVNYNPIRELPSLPAQLRSLSCIHTHLTHLPHLPASLEDLDCDFSQLQSLPSLPENLESIYAHGNQLRRFPLLPLGIFAFDFHENPLDPPFDAIYAENVELHMDAETPEEKQAIVARINKQIQFYFVQQSLKQRQRNIRSRAKNLVRVKMMVGQQDHELGPNVSSLIGTAISGKTGSLNQQLQALYQQLPERQPAGVTQQPFVPPHIQRQKNAETRVRLRKLMREEANGTKTKGGKRRKRSGRKTRKN